MSTSVSESPRGWWQFSLFTLLLAMTWMGLVCVALVSPRELWTALVYVVAIGSILVASLCIVFRTGRARAFAVGYVIFAATYLLYCSEDTAPVPEVGAQLPTTRWGIALYALLHGDAQQLPAVQSATAYFPVSVPAPQLPAGVTVERMVMSNSTNATINLAAPANAPTTFTLTARPMTPLVPLGPFLEVMNSALGVFLGVVGGIAAQILHFTRREDRVALQE